MPLNTDPLLPPKAAYIRLYLCQGAAQLWKTSYRLRWWLGGLLVVMGSGMLGGLPLWALLGVVAVAVVGTLILLGGIRGAAFDPAAIESLWARYAGLPYNPWRILRDRPVAPHPLWDAHRSWAHDGLRGMRLPKIPAKILWPWERPTRIELAAVAVVALFLGFGHSHWRDIIGPLSRIEGVTRAPTMQAQGEAPEILGLPVQTLPSPTPLLMMPVGSTLRVTFPTPQSIIPFVRVGDHKIRLDAKDKQTWTGTLDHPAGGESQVHLGFVSLPLGSLSVVMDQPPRIQWRGQITFRDAGTLTLPYQAQDDFGVQAIMAHSRLVNPQDVAPAFRGVQTWDLQRLDTPPYPLGGTEDTATLEGGEAYAAGFSVDLSLSARDARGQMGETGPQRVVLPLPTYHTPAAAQLYKIRAALIRGGAMAEALRSMTQTLPILPPPAPSMFLAIKSLMLKLQRGTEADRRPIVDLLWGVLQDIEPQKGLNQAQNVQALLDQLAQALSDPNQRAAVMQTLKQALSAYFQQLQTLMKQQGLMPPNSQFDLRPLEDMLNRLEEAAQYGDPAKAAQMIEELKKMMQGMPKGQADLAAMKALQQAMQDLGKLSDAQADLIKTASGKTPESPQKTAAQQGDLKTELTRLQGLMGRFALNPSALDKAKQAMTGAEAA
ncbi:MAG: DUF4175 family protein, partial [Alphaproteobacteria bacterium]